MNNILKNILIFTALTGLVILSVYTYKAAGKFSVPEEKHISIKMKNAQVFYYNDCKEFLSFKAGEIDISDDWKNINAYGNVEGKVRVEENIEPAKFYCKKISYRYFQKSISATGNIKVIMNKNTSMTSESCLIDMNNKNILFDRGLIFKGEYGTASAKSAKVDMQEKSIKMYKIIFKSNLP